MKIPATDCLCLKTRKHTPSHQNFNKETLINKDNDNKVPSNTCVSYNVSYYVICRTCTEFWRVVLDFYFLQSRKMTKCRSFDDCSACISPCATLGSSKGCWSHHRIVWYRCFINATKAQTFVSQTFVIIVAEVSLMVSSLLMTCSFSVHILPFSYSSRESCLTLKWGPYGINIINNRASYCQVLKGVRVSTNVVQNWYDGISRGSTRIKCSDVCLKLKTLILWEVIGLFGLTKQLNLIFFLNALL